MIRPALPTRMESPRISRSIHIRRPAVALYTSWYHLSQRPAVPLGHETSSVTAATLPRIKAPCGHTADHTFIADHIHGLFIAWTSSRSSGVTQSGEVWFHTGNSGVDTTVSVLLSWDVGAGVDPSELSELDLEVAQLEQDLHRFKALMER